MFAATHPGRAAGLILCDAWVTFQQTDETPWMYTTAEWEAICDVVRTAWGSRARAEMWDEGRRHG